MTLEKKIFTQSDRRRTIYYRGGSGQPLVFLHGGGVEAIRYRELLELLAEHYDVVAPNLAGHGGSSAPGAAWQWSDYAEQISKLLEHVSVSRAVVAGHSFGGAVAASLATASSHISKLILIDAAAASPLDWSFGSMWRLMLLQRLVNGTKYRKLSLSFRLIASVVANFARNGTNALATQATMRRLLTRTYSVFNRIPVATLILWGRDDKVFSAATAEAIRSQVSGATVQLMDGDHEWCVFQPQLAARAISNWLNSNCQLQQGVG